ncbi:MAG: cyclic nucleotide-binding domain-containing protein [Candidatus Margulisbacteria bacterium]|nr:cyclic nucleotide-binding domain-containing protein [Candidatus Margulisiibacteriota bacterium]
MKDKKELLDGIKHVIMPRFHLNDEQFYDVFDSAVLTNIKPGIKLFTEGKHNDNIFFIADGIADIYKEGQHLNIVERGDILGEMSLVGVDKSTATVIAKTDMVLFKFNKIKFDILLNRYPLMNKAVVMETISRKIQQYEANRKD